MVDSYSDILLCVRKDTFFVFEKTVKILLPNLCIRNFTYLQAHSTEVSLTFIRQELDFFMEAVWTCAKRSVTTKSVILRNNLGPTSSV